MSYYIDPWLYNCRDNPADTPARAGASSALVIDATQRALKYARSHGVTLVVGRGQRLHRPRQPDVRRQPARTTRRAPSTTAHVDNDCLSMPIEGKGVIGVTSVGPSKRKAYYSDYGIEQTDLSAPGRRLARRVTAPRPAEQDPRAVPEGSRPRRTSRRAGDAPSSVRQLEGDNCWRGMAPGHVDGLAARGRASRRSWWRVRRARPPARRPDARSGQGREDPAPDRARTPRAPSRGSSTTPRTRRAPMTPRARAARTATGSTATAS